MSAACAAVGLILTLHPTWKQVKRGTKTLTDRKTATTNATASLAQRKELVTLLPPLCRIHIQTLVGPHVTLLQ